MEAAPLEGPVQPRRKLSIEDARKVAIRQYRQFDRRPPFSYEVKRRADYYPEIDETEVFKLEGKVFHATEHRAITPLSPSMGPDHPARLCLDKLLEWYGDFKASINAVEVLEAEIHFSKSGVRIPIEDIEVGIDQVRKALGQPIRKELMNQHRGLKQKYLEALRAYQSICSRSKEIDPETKKEAERLYFETQAVSLSHATYTAVRSYIHNKKKGVLRDDHGITMHHLYSCAIHVMNDYREDIEEARAANDWPLERSLRLEMNKEIVIALLHDFDEDLKDIKKSDLKATLIALTRHDTELSGESCLDSPDLEPRPEDYNFIEYYWDEIMVEVESMTKPKDKEARNGYLTKKLTTPLRVIRKGRDRGNNLETLKYMQEKEETGETAGQVQARKIKETPEIIAAGLHLLKNTSSLDQKRLKRSLLFITRISKEQITRLNADYLNEIETPLSDLFFTETEDCLAA